MHGGSADTTPRTPLAPSDWAHPKAEEMPAAADGAGDAAEGVATTQDREDTIMVADRGPVAGFKAPKTV